MSEAKKRRRKSKLEIRVDVEGDKTEYTIMQVQPKVQKLPQVKPTTSETSPAALLKEARREVRKAKFEVECCMLGNQISKVLPTILKPAKIPTSAEITPAVPSMEVKTKSAINQSNPEKTSIPASREVKIEPAQNQSYSDTTPTPPSMEVKIEVEEFDEEALLPSPPLDKECTSISDVQRPQRNTDTILSHKVDIEKIFKVADHISWSSTNMADKYLGIEVKNLWGSIFSNSFKENEDPHEILLQKALDFWSMGGRSRNPQIRSPPCFYQCHICNLAWWYLGPFREHIKLHDLKTLAVTHQKYYSDNMSVIVASEDLIKDDTHSDLKFIPMEGRCPRCGDTSEKHGLMYSSVSSMNIFVNCARMKLFNKYVHIKEFGCNICCTNFLTSEDWNDHVNLLHTVRSDEPVHAIRKRCMNCNKYFDKSVFSTHSCFKQPRKNCPHCYRLFHDTKSTSLHVVIKDSKCDICGGKFNMQCRLTRHMLEHTDKYDIGYKCMDCDQYNIVLPDRISLKMHRLKYHRHKDAILRRLTNRFVTKVIVPTQCLKFPAAAAAAADSNANKGEYSGISTKIRTISSKDSANSQLEMHSVNDILIIFDKNDTLSEKMDKLLNTHISDNSQDCSNYERILSNLMYQGSNVEAAEKPAKKNITEVKRTVEKRTEALRTHEKTTEEKPIQIKVEREDKYVEYDDDGNMSQIDIEETIIKTEPLEFEDFENEITANIIENVSKTVLSENGPSSSETFNVSSENVPSSSEMLNASNEIAQFGIKVEAMDYDENESCKNILIENVTSLNENQNVQSESIEIVRSKNVSNVKVRSGNTSKRNIPKTKPKKGRSKNKSTKRNNIAFKKTQSKKCSSTIIAYERVSSNEPSGNVISGNVSSGNEPSGNVSIGNEPSENVSSGNEASGNVSNGNEPSEDVSTELKYQIKVEPLCDMDEMSDIILMNVDPEILKAIKSEPEETPEVNLQIQENVDKIEKTNPNMILLGKKLQSDTIIKQEQPKKTRKKHEKRLYTCKTCGYTNKHRLFIIHKMSKCDIMLPAPVEGENYTCTKCKLAFGTLKSYLYHFTKHGYNFLSCPDCEVQFEGMTTLLPHFQKHVRQSFVNFFSINKNAEPIKKKNACNKCKQLVSVDQFFTHWESHLLLKDEKGDDNKYQPGYKNNPEQKVTPGCSKILDQNLLDGVLRQLHSQKKEKECVVCSRQFSRRFECKRHVIEHLLMDALFKKSSTPDRTLRCQECDASFVRPEQYKFHMREHAGMPVYRCDLCNKTFSDSSNFAKHKKVHSWKVLICDICKKKFQNKNTLSTHMMMHRTTPPMVCKVCNKVYHNRSLYRKHEKLHKRTTQIFKCIICDEYFKNTKEKWDHAWNVHKERRDVVDCPICNEEFRKYNDMKVHAEKGHAVLLKRHKVDCIGENGEPTLKYMYKITSTLDEHTIVFTDPNIPVKRRTSKARKDEIR